MAKVWDGVTRKFERKLKVMGGLSRNCPICKLEKIQNKSPLTEVIKEVPVTPVTSVAGPDIVEVEVINDSSKQEKSAAPLHEGAKGKVSTMGQGTRRGRRASSRTASSPAQSSWGRSPSLRSSMSPCMTGCT